MGVFLFLNTRHNLNTNQNQDQISPPYLYQELSIELKTPGSTKLVQKLRALLSVKDFVFGGDRMRHILLRDDALSRGARFIQHED